MGSTQRKKLDSRIPTLIANGVDNKHRSFFVVVGDRGKDQVVTLHYLLSKARVSARPNVLWCYKKDLGFTSHRKKRAKQIKSQIARGIRDADEDDPFELFVSSTNVRYTYYKETEKILGNTYGMCILQDFEAVTPNILARTIETVEGGGIVVLLLKTMTSLKQLYTMTMDVHSRYRTESHHDTVARFNERFILSLGNCNTCLFVDDELNILPLSLGKNVKPLKKIEGEENLSAEDSELIELKSTLKETEPLGSLVGCAKTLDQAKAILTFVEAISEKTLRSTVALTAARGRGKSAALGISIAAAIAYGYSNIFIASPSPENLKTLFEFIFKGFDALGYVEHMDYDIVQSVNPDFQKAVVRVNIFRDHRQTIQYIQPEDHQVLSQAELVVIDEAAAIPLPIVRNLLGPYLVFMASTINGYEGTGRSLSLKLLQQLRKQSHAASTAGKDTVVVGRDGKEKNSATTSSSTNARSLHEIQLHTPIRYAANDAVESWLNTLLCLDCCNPSAANSSLFSGALMKGKGPTGCPDPNECELFYVNRDTLFSFHPVSEAFLQRMMSLYVASHYKNSPNDLQLMSDAPAHQLFVLLPPMVPGSKSTTLPDPLVVIQICMEGTIAKNSALASLAKGVRAHGDLIPWVMSQQFQDDDFATLSGARVVRIATHPDYVGMGYGKRALKLLEEYYQGKFIGLDESVASASKPQKSSFKVSDEDLDGVTLQTDKIKIRDAKTMPALLLKLSERPLLPSEHLHWLGVSYGLTPQLHKFWKRAGYAPVYLRQTQNDITGEHTCIMLKSINNEDDVGDVKINRPEWLDAFVWDFKHRFLELLSFQFKTFSPITTLSILEGTNKSSQSDDDVLLNTGSEVSRCFTPFDLKRLDSYSHNLLDYHVIMDLAPALARQYFLGRLSTSAGSPIKPVHFSAVQAAIICGIGLQKKSISELEKELDLPSSQILALFGKIVKKCANFLNDIVKETVTNEVYADYEKNAVELTGGVKRKQVEDESTPRDPTDETLWDPTMKSLDDDLEDAGDEEMIRIRERQKELIGNWDLSKYAIQGTDEDWKSAKIGNTSKIVNIATNSESSKSTKKRKVTATGVAADLASKYIGEKTGIVDPGNVLSTNKKCGKQRKGKNTKK